MLVNISEFPRDVIHKNSGLTQGFLQENFELGPGEKHQDFGFHLLLILLSSVEDFVFEEHNGKKDSIAALRVKRGKIVIALLDKVPIIHIQFIFITV